MHHIPQTLDEALEILNNRHYQVIAGGTDIMVQYRSWSETLPKLNKPLLFVSQIPELNFINESDEFIEIGACTTYEHLLNSPIIPKILKDTIIDIAAPGIRYVGTIGGNIANASPAADGVCTLIALDALVEIVSSETFRIEKICDFITGVKTTSLKPNELIRSIRIPNMFHEHARFYKIGGRKADAISKVALASVCNVSEGRITKWRLAFGAVGPKVVSLPLIDEKMVGKTVEELKETIESIQATYAPFIKPIDDQRSTAVYRKEVALNLIKGFIESL